MVIGVEWKVRLGEEVGWVWKGGRLVGVVVRRSEDATSDALCAVVKVIFRAEEARRMEGVIWGRGSELFSDGGAERRGLYSRADDVPGPGQRCLGKEALNNPGIKWKHLGRARWQSGTYREHEVCRGCWTTGIGHRIGILRGEIGLCSPMEREERTRSEEDV